LNGGIEMAQWIKKGLIFSTDKDFEWMQTHAAVPFADCLVDDIYRMYFTTRDKKNRSHVASIDVDIANPTSYISISEKPLLEPGDIGLFDDSGAMGSCLIHWHNKVYLFYQGWSLGVTVPFYTSIGLAICDNNSKSFKKSSIAPVFDRNNVDYMTSIPFVMIEDDVWRMWYGAYQTWRIENNKPKHYYCIKYAESLNGKKWNPTGKVCIDFKSNAEYAITRPSVLKENGVYKMWYCYRGDSYRIGYAESYDGITWERKDDEVGIDVSKSGWDSEMIEYPFVFIHKGSKYMLYNGNRFGKSGFGYAVWQ
jgi:hypothetical protein